MVDYLVATPEAATAAATATTTTATTTAAAQSDVSSKTTLPFCCRLAVVGHVVVVGRSYTKKKSIQAGRMPGTHTHIEKHIM